jgi:hypothetical protein
MKILYNNSEIKNGVFLTPTETHSEPKIEYNAKPNTLYTLIMHDPDAVAGNLLHWVIVNIDGNNVNNGDELLKYKGPAPPKGSGTHSYIFMFYEQKDRINTQISKRIMPMVGLYKKLDVSLKPVYSEYFTSKYQDGGKNKKSSKTTKTRNSYKKSHNTRRRNK